MNKKIFYTKKIEKISKILEYNDIKKIRNLIYEIIEIEDDDYLKEILIEMERNLNNSIDFIYLGLIEIIDYLGLDNEDCSEIYKKYYIYIENQ